MSALRLAVCLSFVLLGCGPILVSEGDGGSGGGSGGGAGGGSGGGAAGVDSEWAQWPAPPDAPPATNYQVNGGVITDSVTGLKWQQVLSTARQTHAEAVAYCDGLSLDGLRWRLPTIVELVSIVGYGRVAPAIDTSVFPGTLAEPYWSSSVPSGLASTHRWVVDFIDGTGTAKEKSLGERVRCVSCPGGSCAVPTASAGAPQGRYVVNAETVRDTVTSLTWQRNVSASSIKGSSTACHTLALDGAGWRLPTVKELQSLTDVRGSGAAVDEAAFPATPVVLFWSSTAAANSGWVWVVAPTGIRSESLTMFGAVRCVR